MTAMAALTAAVWLRMYFVRMAEIRTRRLRLQQLATSRDIGANLQDVATADNFRNLFEVPVLFYAICLALAVAGAVTPLQVVLAWAFVVLRGVHSVIHLTYNRVYHRFLAYAASTTCVLLMWMLFALRLATSQT